MEEFQKNFDNIIERVENGERVVIIDDNNKASVMIPIADDFVRIHRDHEEGC